MCMGVLGAKHAESQAGSPESHQIKNTPQKLKAHEEVLSLINNKENTS